MLAKCLLFVQFFSTFDNLHKSCCFKCFHPCLVQFLVIDLRRKLSIFDDHGSVGFVFFEEFAERECAALRLLENRKFSFSLNIVMCIG